MKKTALCLAGDGAKLPIKAGMLKAYEEWRDERDFNHDMLFGTSSGALGGAIYHQGGLDALLDLCMKIRKKDVYYIAPPFFALGPDAAFFNADPLNKLIRKIVKPDLLRKNPIPFKFNITNIQTLDRVELEVSKCADEDIYRGLFTSASVPVVFPIRRWGGEAYCDGGITNDYCVGQAILNGAQRIILMTSLVAERKPVRNWIDALQQTISAGVDSQMVRELEWARQAGIEVTVIRPDRPTNLGILDFDYKDKKGLIDWGYTIAKRELAKIDVRS
jgi:predicted acylesterase/phospholipase RssA